MGEIRKQRNVEPTKAALGSRSVHPGKMSEVRVHAASNNLGVQGSKLFDPVIEGQNLSWAHEGKVQGVKEEHQILSTVI